MSRNFPFNVAAMVQSVIGQQEYTYEPWLGRTRNSRGVYVDSYGSPESRMASIQPVSSVNANKMGLSLDTYYIKIIDVNLVNLLTRTENAGRISYNGYYWIPQTPSQDWQDAGGWNEVVCSRGDLVSA